MRIRFMAFAAFAIACMSTTADAQPKPYIGEVMLFAGNYCPFGWLPASGELLPISQYTTLFAIVGTSYGGNGTTNFAVPKGITVSTSNGPALTACIAFQGAFPPRN